MNSKQDVIDIGSRRELFVDEYLIDRMKGNVQFQLHQPLRREIVFRTNAPWEGNGSNYQSVFRDGDKMRLYYRGGHHPASEAYKREPRTVEILCLAESTDGINWVRTEPGICEYRGSYHNNIILTKDMVKVFEGSPAHTAVFKDTNPASPKEELYKMVIRGKGGLYLLASPDGVHFQPKSNKPFMTVGAFDSQNLAFWDTVRNEYRLYHRGLKDGLRDILTSSAPNFESFPEPAWLSYPESSVMTLYTNQIQPYYRAPHIFVGFPTRYIERGWSGPMLDLPGLKERLARAKRHPRYGMALTEAVFMTSRDGLHFKRWSEAFIRPGPRQRESWVYGDNYIFWGMYETPSGTEDAPDELSLMATEGYWEGEDTAFRRYTLRIDGFVSLRAPYSGGEITTKPLTFSGGSLSVNAETSAYGSFRLEIQDISGKPLQGFSINECEPIFCDSLDYTVRWNSPAKGDLRSLSGKPIRLRMILQDADIYSFKFVPFRPAPANKIVPK
jgi:hypothetical protein